MIDLAHPHYSDHTYIGTAAHPGYQYRWHLYLLPERKLWCVHTTSHMEDHCHYSLREWDTPSTGYTTDSMDEQLRAMAFHARSQYLDTERVRIVDGILMGGE